MIGTTLGYDGLGSLILFVNGDRVPERDEWKVYVDFIKERVKVEGKVRLIVVAGSGAPNAVQRGHKYPEQAKDVQFNPVGQIVGRFEKMRPSRDVIFDMVEECIEATERMNALMNQSAEA